MKNFAANKHESAFLILRGSGSKSYWSFNDSGGWTFLRHNLAFYNSNLFHRIY